MKSKSVIALALLLAHPPIAGSQPADCARIETSQQVFECASKSRSDADRALNSGYKRLIADISRTYRTDPIGNELLSELRASQRAWIRLRDADCALEAFGAERESQAYEATLNNCIARKSIERIRYLREIIDAL